MRMLREGPPPQTDESSQGPLMQDTTKLPRCAHCLYYKKGNVLYVGLSQNHQVEQAGSV